eukprot:1890740-Amphidinium_carterae.3
MAGQSHEPAKGAQTSRAHNVDGDAFATNRRGVVLCKALQEESCQRTMAWVIAVRGSQATIGLESAAQDCQGKGEGFWFQAEGHSGTHPPRHLRWPTERTQDAAPQPHKTAVLSRMA